jgi:hypothetical protein
LAYSGKVEDEIMRFHRRGARLPKQMLVLAALLMSVRGTCAQSGPSPREVVERFCELDARGRQLEVGGWLQLARMFIPQRELSPGPIVVLFYKLEVIRGFSIGDLVMEGRDRAKLSVRYSFVGEIDYDSLTFSSQKGSSSGQMTKDYNLLLTTKQYDIGAHSSEVLQSGSKAWRIEGSPSEPHISIDAAILYVAQLQAKATKSGIKENANRTIDALKQLRQDSDRGVQK